MRKFIDIVNEAKLVDGVYTAVLPRDLARLVAQGDLRGAAVADKVYLWSAYNDTHYGMRGRLGLPSETGSMSEDDADGFNFFIAPTAELRADLDYRDEAGEKAEGREDWMFNPPTFEVGEVGIWVDTDADICLSNAQFARMVNQARP